MIRQFLAIFRARSMEFLRDRGTFFWNLLFPIVLVAGFALAFGQPDEKVFKIGVIGPTTGIPAILSSPQFQQVPYPADQEAEALKKLRQHQLDLAVAPAQHRYWMNAESGKSILAERLLADELKLAASSMNPSTPALSLWAKGAVTGKPIRYVDWAVPGVISMNMLFSCLFGVGYVLVRYRKNGVLKRLKATPVSALTFLVAQAVSRLVIVLGTVVVVYAGTDFFLHFTMNGSYFDLLLVTVLGIVCLISLGLVFAARFRSEELANGLMNLLTFPMIVFSGVFFSLEGAPAPVRAAAEIFPLTHLIHAERQIMLNGAGLLQVAPDLGALALMTVVFLAIAAWLFKWE
ncbi:MAG: ABC transporter permease [Spirochaetales bacterium]|nr:ABC transporter permease [Spirochaetales bacterium]